MQIFQPSKGQGTVTSVSVVANNGVTGSVATSTTTPAITLTLGAITPTSVVGTTTNNNAPAGSVGELITATIASGSAVSLSTGTAANITSISLTAGDWDVTGMADFTFGGATSVTYLAQGISSTSATLGAQDTFSGVAVAAMVIGSANDMSLPTPTVRISLASTTTIYLVAKAVFSVSTCVAYGSIRARRIR